MCRLIFFAILARCPLFVVATVRFRDKNGHLSLYREKAREEKEGERRLWERCVNRLRFSICSDLKKRGVRNVFIACHDNLKGLGDAINAVFSEAKQQL